MNKTPVKDLLFLVDEKDSVLGYEDKEKCHDGDGILHRAFSIFIFNDKNQLLLQRRSVQKRLWPLYWSNSVCSHPRKGEDNEEATCRRLKEELGIETKLKYLFKFQYQAKFGNHGSENELCSVFVGKCNAVPEINYDEVAEVKFVNLSELAESIKAHPEVFTPWFLLEWDSIITKYLSYISEL